MRRYVEHVLEVIIIACILVLCMAGWFWLSPPT